MQKGKVDLDYYLCIANYLKDDIKDDLIGSEGKCFIEGRKIIKIYFSPKDKSQLVDLSKYKSERISFPKYYLEKDNLRYGEVLPYFKGRTLDMGLNDRANINSFKFNYYEMIDEISEFPNIWMNEIDYYKNIIYLPLNCF